MGTDELLRVRVRAEPENVGAARRTLEDGLRAAGLNGDLVGDVLIATNEAVSNVVAHAYRHRPGPGDLELSVSREGGRLTVIVADDGCGPVPNPESPGLGMGIPLMTALSESIEIRGEPDRGTEVRMSFQLPA
jgi:serine/threonine-protein kinase RsbW/stage II sporulation protein AB (anti-sigma F factor)